MAYSDSDDNDLLITQNSFSVGPSIRTAYLAAEDLLNIGLDNISNKFSFYRDHYDSQLKQFVNILRLVCIC